VSPIPEKQTPNPAAHLPRLYATLESVVNHHGQPPEDDSATPPLLRHLERTLGRFRQGYHYSEPEGVGFLEFTNQPVAGALTFTTFGVNHHLLRHPSGALIRQELLVCQYQPESSDQSLLPVLSVLATDLVSTHVAIPRGHVVGPNGPIVPGSALEAFYFTEPLYYPEELFECSDREPPTFVLWAIPVSPQEAEFARRNGPDAFEDLLRSRDPDVLDLGRPSFL
jgi:hypothetical protein